VTDTYYKGVSLSARKPVNVREGVEDTPTTYYHSPFPSLQKVGLGKYSRWLLMEQDSLLMSLQNMHALMHLYVLHREAY
jgi:hypothetical protein